MADNSSKKTITLDNLNTFLSCLKAEKGEPNGFASLDSEGKIPASQLSEDVADISVTANEFSESTSYSVGDYVIYEGDLYVCIQDHTAGSWDSTHFTITNIADQLELKQDKTLGTPIIVEGTTYITIESAVNAINEKSGSATSITNEFSENTSYTVGDYVVYEGDLYKCTTNHPAGVWNINHFTKTTINDEFMVKGRDYVTAGRKGGTSLGTGATAEGGNTEASGVYSHSEGQATKATALNSHSEGTATQATATASHSEGQNTAASGISSHSEGEGTKASHQSSHSEGSHTQTGANYQHVQGKYNVGKSDTVFEIGWGTGNGNRINIFEVDTEGNVTIAGDLKAGNGTSLENMIAASKIGIANGVASLDSIGKVPSTQLPSYVDDVLEYASISAFPATGESGKIYVALDTNKTYRWGGTGYVEISESLAIGETATTAFAGNRGKAIEDKLPSNASSSNKLATMSDIPTVPSASSSNPEMDGTASAGSSTSWAKGDHVHPSDTSKQNVNLSSPIIVDEQQYTTVETAINAINNKSVSVTVDSAMSTTSINPVQNKVITEALDGKVSKMGDTITGDLTIKGSIDIWTAGSLYYALNDVEHHDVRFHSFSKGASGEDNVGAYIGTYDRDWDIYQYSYDRFDSPSYPSPGRYIKIAIYDYRGQVRGDEIYSFIIDSENLPTATQSNPISVPIPADIYSVEVMPIDINSSTTINTSGITTTGEIIDGNGNSFSNMISTSQKGVANGVATLDSNGKVPASQLPTDTGLMIKKATFKMNSRGGSEYDTKDLIRELGDFMGELLYNYDSSTHKYGTRKAELMYLTISDEMDDYYNHNNSNERWYDPYDYNRYSSRVSSVTNMLKNIKYTTVDSYRYGLSSRPTEVAYMYQSPLDKYADNGDFVRLLQVRINLPDIGIRYSNGDINNNAIASIYSGDNFISLSQLCYDTNTGNYVEIGTGNYISYRDIANNTSLYQTITVYYHDL